MRRILSLVACAALAASSLVLLGASGASAQTGPVGYTVGVRAVGLSDCLFYSVNLETGEATQVSPGEETQPCADGLTFSADGTLYAYRQLPIEGSPSITELITIDLANGEQTKVGTGELPPVFIGGGGMTFDAAGNLWLYGQTFGDADCPDFSEACLWQVDPTTGTAQFVAENPGSEATGVFGLAATCSDVLALTSSIATGPAPSSQTAIQSVDTATAALTPVVDTPEIFIPEGMDFDSAGGLWALGVAPVDGTFGDQQLHPVDLTTGEAPQIPITIEGEPFLGFLAGLAISPLSCEVPPPTPEPVVLQPTFTG